MAKRPSKEQLETDALVTTYARFSGFVQQNVATVIAGTLVFLLLIGAGIWYYFHLQAQEVEAQELLVTAEQFFDQSEYESALYGDQETFAPGFIDIINNYSRTDAANIARYYAAVSAGRLGDSYQALEFIERYNPPSGILGVGPIAFHGTILGNLGEFADAARQFERAANWDENNVTTPQNLLLAAQASLEGGDSDSARRYLDTIITNYQGSQVAEQALHMQGMLEARG